MSHLSRVLWGSTASLLLAATLLFFPLRVSGADAPPNILLILVDDLGVGDLSSFGAEDIRSPHVDSLVRRGMRFDNFYANCPVCSPTRAAILTGRYPELVGVPGVIRTHPSNSWGYLSHDAILLPRVLKSAGYATAIIGKWHLGLDPPNTPTYQGFDEFRGWLGDMMDDYYTHRRHGINYMRSQETVIDPTGHATDLFTAWACAYLEGRRGQAEPFFLYLAYNAPHVPIQPPEDWLGRVLARQPGIDPVRARLVALIEQLDDAVGKVLETLRNTGLEQNTLVIFTSDNGGQLSVAAHNGPWRDGKESMYEGGLRVPMVACWPGRIAAGTSSGRMAMTMDLFPTLAEAAGVCVNHAIDGISFLPVLLGRRQPEPRRDLFFARREGGNRYGGKTIEAIRRGDWKLLQNSPFAALELYNLKDDPAETTDLAARFPDKYNELAAALRGQIQRAGSVPWQPAPHP